MDEQSIYDTEGQTEEEGTPIHEADDESLDAELERLVAEESDEVLPEETLSEPEEEQGYEDEQEDGPEDHTPDKTEEPLGQDNEAREAQYRTLIQQLEQQEQFIKRRNSEVGLLRKERQQLIEKLRAGLDDKFAESPSEALRDREIIQQTEQELAQIEQQHAVEAMRHHNEKVVAQHLNPNDVQISAMVDVLKSDNLPDNVIHQFVADPYGSVSADALIHLAKRAYERQQLQHLYQYAKRVTAERDKLKGKASSVLSRVQRVSRQTPTITARSGGSSATHGRDISEADVTKLSDDELEQLLQTRT